MKSSACQQHVSATLMWHQWGHQYIGLNCRQGLIYKKYNTAEWKNKFKPKYAESEAINERPDSLIIEKVITTAADYL